MPRGRPKKQIDKTQFERLCGLQCTLEEICCYFGCDNKTLEKWCMKTYKYNFSEVFRVKRGNGKISLRRRQFEVAMDGNPTMLIFLGKNMLNQSDRTVADTGTSDGKLTDLIEGLKENDLHTETTAVDETLAEKPAPENQYS